MITSVKNPIVTDVLQLAKKKSYRQERGLFVVEGAKMFFEVEKGDIDSIYMTKDFADKYKERLTGYDYQLVSEDVLARMSDTVTPQGVIALVRMKKYDMGDITAGVPSILILDGIQDPGNMGTMLRSCEGAGFGGLLISPDSVDIYNPKVVRSTMGAIFRVPFVISRNLISDIELLKSKGIAVYSACLDDSVAYTDVDCTVPLAYVVGNESNGVRPQTIEASTGKVHIPMKGQVESLNASIAATLLMFEVLRQRS